MRPMVGRAGVFVRTQAIFLPRVRGTVSGACWAQYLLSLYMDRIVLPWGSSSTRPLGNGRDGRPPPVNGVPATEPSLMPAATSTRGRLFPGGRAPIRRNGPVREARDRAVARQPPPTPRSGATSPPAPAMARARPGRSTPGPDGACTPATGRPDGRPGRADPQSAVTWAARRSGRRPTSRACAGLRTAPCRRPGPPTCRPSNTARRRRPGPPRRWEARPRPARRTTGRRGRRERAHTCAGWSPGSRTGRAPAATAVCGSGGRGTGSSRSRRSRRGRRAPSRAATAAPSRPGRSASGGRRRRASPAGGPGRGHVPRGGCLPSRTATPTVAGLPRSVECGVLAKRLVVDGLGHAEAQRLGHLVAALHGDDLAQLGLEVERLQAREAVVEVLLDVGPAGVVELAVEEVVQPMDGVVAVAHHRSPTRPCAIPKSYNAFCSALLPRWSLLMTVPMGTSRISAISL